MEPPIYSVQWTVHSGNRTRTRRWNAKSENVECEPEIWLGYIQERDSDDERRMESKARKSEYDMRSRREMASQMATADGVSGCQIIRFIYFAVVPFVVPLAPGVLAWLSFKSAFSRSCSLRGRLAVPGVLVPDLIEPPRERTFICSGLKEMNGMKRNPI
jgi:hypothetical protein